MGGNLPWYSYLQLQHLLGSPIIKQATQLSKSTFKQLLIERGNIMTGILSNIYRILIEYVSLNLTSYQIQWQKSNALALEDTDWLRIYIAFPFHSSISVYNGKQLK